MKNKNSTNWVYIAVVSLFYIPLSRPSVFHKVDVAPTCIVFVDMENASTLGLYIGDFSLSKIVNTLRLLALIYCFIALLENVRKGFGETI